MGPLARRVLLMCDATLNELDPGSGRDRVRHVRDALREPLRVAVAGRLKAGKSTLINALLRQRIADVDVGECTRVVTWFRYGVQERVEVTAHDGRTWSLALDPEGRLPRSLGAEPAAIDRVTVWLSNEALRDVVVIDTPGLDSLEDAHSAATERLLAVDDGSRRAIGQADALVFLMPHLGRVEDELLAAFRALYSGTGLSVVNVVGVVSKVDLLADGQDPMREGEAVAESYSRRLRAEVAAVVPVIGLLAETALTDALTERDAATLRAVAALPPETVQQLLVSPGWFVDVEVPVARHERERLVTLLDLHGIRRALEVIAAGAPNTAALLEQLNASSGMDRLEQLLRDLFTGRADILKAHVALNDLERICYDDPEAQPAFNQLRYAIEDLRLDPAMQRLNELEAMRIWSNDEQSLPESLAESLHRVVRHADPRARLGLDDQVDEGALANAALEQATTWLAFQNDPRTSPSGARIAELVRDSLGALHQEAARG